jgi:UDPglucose 6-dehydrogenase
MGDSMNIGFIGLGKLGLPCAAAMSVKTGKTIYGYDVNPNIQKYIDDRKTPYIEGQLEEYLSNADFSIKESIDGVLDNADIVFVAVPTPHIERFEGNCPMPDDRADFDYNYLKDVVKKIQIYLENNKDKNLDIVIISTVLPGTIRSQILPLLTMREGVNLFYNPYFIAMGTTIHDFLNPEFILIGRVSEDSERLVSIYKSFLSCPIVEITLESAELTKVAYNTFIGMKIVFANTLAEITEKIGGHVDEVTNTLSLGSNRIISNRYMKAGMGDGGGCHPRDQIAMSWLAQKLDLSFDIFEMIAKARDEQSLYFAKLLKKYQEERRQKVIILGNSYKKNVGITVGSPSILLQHYLKELDVDFIAFDPLQKEEDLICDGPSIFFVATPHDVFQTLSLPEESIVIDPWANGNNPSVSRQYLVWYKGIGRPVEIVL